jgi:uncharacterized membrane protein YphA (DoxX/SURF4 family)
VDTALLLLRTVVGLYVAAHGARFLFSWFGGLGFTGTQGGYEQTLTNLDVAVSVAVAGAGAYSPVAQPQPEAA